jgi:FkbH-like protein
MTTASFVASRPPGVFFFDLAGLANSYGLNAWRDLRFWFNSKHDMAFDTYGIVAHALARTVAGIRGLGKKVCVVDLDNTVWGGVIGDDGVNGIRVGPDAGAEGEAFMAFQQYLKGIKERGVMLAVCSKNSPDIAQEPFLTHPGMVLKLDDFSAFEANWDDKPANMRKIAGKLNVNLDSFVFIDDNPMERESVKRVLPEVTVIDMPEDPALYIQTVSGLFLFENPRLTDEDIQRTAMMRTEQHRQALREKPEYATLDLPSFLKSLELAAISGEVEESTLMRATQLINKTNQFNINALRITEQEVKSHSTRAVAKWYSLSDRFGNYGIVSVVLAHAENMDLVVDSWVLSCRAFQRTLEEFVLRDVVEFAKRLHCSSVVLNYVKTDRNGIVPVVLERIGFEKAGKEGRESECYRFLVGSVIPPTYVEVSSKGEKKN